MSNPEKQSTTDGPAETLAVAAGSAWYSGALDVLRPLRWHLNELVSEMESYNRYAKRIGAPTLPEAKIVAARAANEAADKFFSPNTQVTHGRAQP